MYKYYIGVIHSCKNWWFWTKFLLPMFLHFREWLKSLSSQWSWPSLGAEALGSPSLVARLIIATTYRKYWTTPPRQMDDSGPGTGSSLYAPKHTSAHLKLFLGMRCVPWLFFQVNGHDVTYVADDVAMTILRSSPRRLNMTLGRAVSNLVAPPPCDSLPDIVLHKTPSGQLGGSPYNKC